jgi:hypothetical protein
MDKQRRIEELATEKGVLANIRSLKEDDRFRRYFALMKARYEATVDQLDMTPADDVVANADIRGVRRTYKHEINLVENAEKRIKDIDDELKLLNKGNENNTKGKDGRPSAVPPKR